MRLLYDIIKELANTSSTNEKVAILQGLNDTEQTHFQTIARLAYDPRINFWVKEVGVPHSGSLEEPSTDADLLAALADLQSLVAQRKITGNEAREWIVQTYNALPFKLADVFARVVKRDLRCGVSTKTINAVFPKLIYSHPYMRCSAFSEKNLSKISFPCISQVKMDGLYIDIVVSEDSVKYYTRNGNVNDQLNNPHTDSILINHYPNTVWMGEAVAVDEDGNMMNRQESNGYLNSDNVDSNRVNFYLWDLVSLEDFYAGKSEVPYSDRLNHLIEGLLTVNALNINNMHLVGTVKCETSDDIMNHFKGVREHGGEGTVIKDNSGQWKNGTSQHQIKCKVIFDVDLKVVGYKEGTGKNEGKLGALICETSDGLLRVSVGGGYKDKEREDFIKQVDQMIDNETIITVRGNDVVRNQDDESLYSIFLPRFVEVRTDKDEADTLEQVQEQVRAFTNALDMIK